MARGFTTKTVENLKPDPDKRREIPDPALSGLYLIVQPSGAKSWAVRYRHSGNPRKLTLGKWPIIGVAAARAAASEALERVVHGEDPNAQKRTAKSARADLVERDTICALVEQFDRRHLSQLKSGREARRILDRHVVSVWGDWDVHDISRRDVIDVLDEIADSGRGTTANRVRSHLSNLFNWCVQRGVLDIAPTLGVKAPAKEFSRDRVLSDEEVRWFWRACKDLGQTWGPLGKMLLLTGQRLGEVVAMTDGEIVGDTWHLSGERTKNARAHDVPLSGVARAVLADVERVRSPDGYVFTTTGANPVSGYYKARNRIASRMAEIAADERGEPVEIDHWTFHDLRRTCATGMAKLGVPLRVGEAVLNHISGSGGGIAAIYVRHDYADEKRQALEAWARYVEDLIEGKSPNVVKLSEAAR